MSHASHVRNPSVQPDPHGEAGDTVETHPAYAQISAARVQGHTHLYGSDLDHQTYMRLVVHTSQLHRSGGVRGITHNPAESIVEIKLSHTQWAELLSSGGLPTTCTISAIHGEYVPDIPPPEDPQKRFSNALGSRLDIAMSRLEELSQSIAKSALPKGVKSDMQREIDAIRLNLANNLDYVGRLFQGHMDKIVQGAKADFQNTFSHLLTETGRAALEQNMPGCFPALAGSAADAPDTPDVRPRRPGP